MLRTTLLVTVCALGAPALAQSKETSAKPLTARAFHFDNHKTVLHLDMKAVRDTGVWDEINTSALRMLFGLIEKELGFPLDHLDRVMTTRAPIQGANGEAVYHEVTTIEGNADLGPLRREFESYEAERIGSYELLRAPWGGDAVAVLTPTLRVSGAAAIVAAVLGGKPQSGLPSADVMAFVAGHENLLLHSVLDLSNEDNARSVFDGPLEGVQWPEGDRPTVACARVKATGDEDDPHITLEVVLRHGKVGEGLAVTEKAVQGRIRDVAKMTQARLFRPLLKKIEHERRGTDAIWRVDLGRARDAAGLLGTLSPFMMVSRKVEAVQAVPAPVEVVEEEPAEKPKAGGGK